MNKEELLAMPRGLPGEIGIYIHDMGTGEKLCHGEHLSLRAASVIKLPIMAAAFTLREAGQLDFEERYRLREADKMPSCGALTYMHEGLEVTVRDLVTLMIILSDNTATNILIDRLGMGRINAIMQDMGLRDSVLRRRLFDSEASARGIENTVSAADMGHLLERIQEKTLVSAGASMEMMQILLNQRLNGKMPFYLHEEGIRVAHKTGEDDGITHDVGVIFADTPRIFCFLSNETDVPAAERVIAEMAKELAV